MVDISHQFVEFLFLNLTPIPGEVRFAIDGYSEMQEIIEANILNKNDFDIVLANVVNNIMFYKDRVEVHFVCMDNQDNFYTLLVSIEGGGLYWAQLSADTLDVEDGDREFIF